MACGGNVIYDHPLSPEDQALLLSVLRESGLFTMLESRDASFVDDGFQSALDRAGPGNSELERWRTALKNRYGVRPMSDYKGEPLYKAVFAVPDARRADWAGEALKERFSCRIFRRSPYLINGEFISVEFDKGRAVGKVCDWLGVPVADTVGFGDSMNDLELIETAGVGVCMGKGSPELAERADLVCPGVEEDGVAWAMEKLGLI